MIDTSYLQSLVTDRCKALGVAEAAVFFGVSEGLIRQWTAGSKTPSLASVELVFQVPTPPMDLSFTPEWAGKEVFLALPFYKSVDPRTLFGILGIWDRQKFGASVRYGDAYIVHTRNILMQDYLSSGLPWCLWIDDDIIVPRGDPGWFKYVTDFNIPDEFAGMHTPTRLRSYGKTLIGGLYFGRGPRARAIYYEAMTANDAGRRENDLARSAPANRIRECWWTGTGCLMHTREVPLSIQEKFPHLAPQHKTEPWHFFANSDDKLHQAFSDIKLNVDAAAAALKNQNGAEAEKLLVDAVAQITSAEKANKTHSQLMQGEDQTFGKRAKEAGHQSYVDHGLVCGHAGGCVYGPHNTGKFN